MKLRSYETITDGFQDNRIHETRVSNLKALFYIYTEVNTLL